MAHFNRGLASYYLEKYEQSVEAFSRAIELRPDEAETYTNRARAYLKLGQRELALQDYAMARRIRWYDPDPH